MVGGCVGRMLSWLIDGGGNCCTRRVDFATQPDRSEVGREEREWAVGIHRTDAVLNGWRLWWYETRYQRGAF
jgi:hypothetical protein